MDAQIEGTADSSMPFADRLLGVLGDLDKEFQNTINRFGPWYHNDRMRLANDDPDSLPYLIEGIKLALELGNVCRRAHERYGEAVALIHEQIARFEASDEGKSPTAGYQQRAVELEKRHQLMHVKHNGHEKSLYQACQMFDELQYRYFCICATRQAGGSTEPVIYKH